MKRLIAVSLLLAGSLWLSPVSGQDDAETEAEYQPLHPSQLAAESDAVVLAQVDRVNYETRRGFPVSGAAWIRVLVRYKVPSPIDFVKVAEEGFGPDRCYFDDGPMWEELPRYLVFLNRADKHEFEGHRGGCKLEVLVTDDNRYAVRWPQEGLVLNPEDEALIQELTFQGPGAYVDVSEMTSIGREDLLREYHMVDTGDNRYRYTRGIRLEDFREHLIGSDNLTRDRQQRGW